MLRTLLVGILAVSVTPACKGGSDAPAVQPGITAGKVIELVGSVTATRDGKPRTLAANDEVSGDDIIDTGDSGRVMIWLTHNNATWDLPAHRKQRVGDSTAWKAERVAAVPAAVTEATISGGRHAEKSAVDTSVTAPPAQQPAQGTAVEPAADPPAPPPPTMTTPPADTGAAPDAKRVEAKPTRPAAKGAPPVMDGEGVGGGGVETARKKALTDKMSEEERSVNRNDADDANVSASRGAKAIMAPGAATPGADAQLATHHAALASCLDGSLTLPITLVVTKGKVSFIAATATDKQRACITKVAAKFSFAPTVDVRVNHTLSK